MAGFLCVGKCNDFRARQRRLVVNAGTFVAMTDSLATALYDLRHLLENGALEQADIDARTLLVSQPDNPELLNMLAQIKRRQFQPLAAVEYMYRAAQQQPKDVPTWLRYAADLAIVGRIDDLQVALTQVATLAPQNPQLGIQLAHLQYLRRNYVGARETLAVVVEKFPRFAAARLDLAYVLLMLGHWRAGWAAYEARFALPHTRNMIPNLPSQPWTGQTIKGRLLLIADQGYGDCFQFARYIPLAAQRCSSIVLMRSPQLAGVLDSVTAVSAGYERWEHTPKHEAYCTLSGLPRVFETTPESIPSPQNLIRVDTHVAQRWRERVRKLAPKATLRVGLAWSGRLEFNENYLRSLPVQGYAALMDIPGCAFFSLQFGALAAEADVLGMINTSAEQTPFSEAAGLLETLDLVITVDTATAHLAGSLGRPTWLLLNRAPDWRWGPSGHRSPWYPSMRVFRQDASRSWLPVIADVRAALELAANAEDSQAALNDATSAHSGVATEGL